MIVPDVLTWWAAAGAVLVLLAVAGRLVEGYRASLHLAGIDDLTGLGERRAFRRELDAAVRTALARREPLALVLLDVPAVAAVQRAHGMRAADSVLTDTAWVLASAGQDSLAFRLGGSTFAVLLPDRDGDAAREVATRLGRHVETVTAAGGTVSAVCTLDERCPDAETMLIGADAALTDAMWRQLADALAEPTDTPVIPLPRAERRPTGTAG